MQNKVRELEQVTSQTPPDMKRLQLVLQGSVSVQVIGLRLVWNSCQLNGWFQWTYEG